MPTTCPATGGVAGAREGVERVEVTQITESGVAVGQPRVGGRVPGICFDGLVELPSGWFAGTSIGSRSILPERVGVESD